MDSLVDHVFIYHFPFSLLSVSNYVIRTLAFVSVYFAWHCLVNTLQAHSHMLLSKLQSVHSFIHLKIE